MASPPTNKRHCRDDQTDSAEGFELEMCHKDDFIVAVCFVNAVALCPKIIRKRECFQPHSLRVAIFILRQSAPCEIEEQTGYHDCCN
jgi:hypothetical protein